MNKSLWSAMKLGRVPSRHDERTLKVANYLATVPTPPDKVDYTAGTQTFPMFANDHVGDCTIAASGHMIEVWTKQARGKRARITTSEVIAMYEAVSGYDTRDPSTDQGAEPLDVLRYWRKVGLHGHRIQAFAEVNRFETLKLKQALWVFGGLYIGLDLPLTAQQQREWDVETYAGYDGQPGSWGCHAVNAVGYDGDGIFVITWGHKLKMTWAFWREYGAEGFAVLSPDWLNAGIAPSGLNLEQLECDLVAIGEAG